APTSPPTTPPAGGSGPGNSKSSGGSNSSDSQKAPRDVESSNGVLTASSPRSASMAETTGSNATAGTSQPLTAEATPEATPETAVAAATGSQSSASQPTSGS